MYSCPAINDDMTANTMYRRFTSAYWDDAAGRLNDARWISFGEYCKQHKMRMSGATMIFDSEADAIAFKLAWS